MTHAVYIFATIRVKSDFFETARAAIARIVAPTLREEGCQRFSLFTSQAEPNTLHLYETFDNEEALSYHYAQTYTREVFEAYREWLAEPVIIQKLTPVALQLQEEQA